MKPDKFGHNLPPDTTVRHLDAAFGGHDDVWCPICEEQVNFYDGIQICPNCNWCSEAS